MDALIRDCAYNRPAAVAIGMAVGAAVEAEVRKRYAKSLASLHAETLDEAAAAAAALYDRWVGKS